MSSGCLRPGCFLDTTLPPLRTIRLLSHCSVQWLLKDSPVLLTPHQLYPQKATHPGRQAGRQSAPLQGAPSKWLWVRLSWSGSPISRAKVPALRELLGEGETEVHEPKSRCMGGKKWGRVVRGGGIAWVFDRCWGGPGLGDGEVRGGLPCLLPKAFPHLSGGRTGWGGRVWLSGHTN